MYGSEDPRTTPAGVALDRAVTVSGAFVLEKSERK